MRFGHHLSDFVQPLILAFDVKDALGGFPNGCSIVLIGPSILETYNHLLLYSFEIKIT